MATASSIPTPTKASDLVLSRMQKKMFERWVSMWKRCGTGLGLHAWTAQRLETLTVDDYTALHAIGVNNDRAPSPILDSKPAPKRRVATPTLSASQREAIRQLVISGRISPTSPAAQCAAEEES